MVEIKFPQVNNVILSGRLTADPELRYTPSGVAVCNMRMAANRSYKTASGDYEQETTFFGAVAWQKLAEICSQYLGKGSPVLIEGRLRSRTWQDKKSGQSRTVLEVHAEQVQFLEKLGEGNGQPESEPESEPAQEDADRIF